MHGVLPPTTLHQRVVTKLVTLISNLLQEEKGEVFMGLSVWFDEEGFVVPDLVVVCDNEKIQSKGCIGSPDLVIEVMEPSTALEDKGLKRRLYRDMGVKEYWIVDLSYSLVEIFQLNGNEYGESTVYGGSQVIPIGILEGTEINLGGIFTNS